MNRSHCLADLSRNQRAARAKLVGCWLVTCFTHTTLRILLCSWANDHALCFLFNVSQPMHPCHFPVPPPLTRATAAFSAMYNMFIDKDVLSTIHDVASRLASSAATPSEWASTELGGLVRFTDDRSQDRVRKILSAYTDGSLQEKGMFMRIRKERSSFLATYMPKGKNINFLSRAMGLSSLRLSETMVANDDMRRQCKTRPPGVISCFSCLLFGFLLFLLYLPSDNNSNSRCSPKLKPLILFLALRQPTTEMFELSCTRECSPHDLLLPLALSFHRFIATHKKVVPFLPAPCPLLAARSTKFIAVHSKAILGFAKSDAGVSVAIRTRTHSKHVVDVRAV